MRHAAAVLLFALSLTGCSQGPQPDYRLTPASLFAKHQEWAHSRQPDAMTGKLIEIALEGSENLGMGDYGVGRPALTAKAPGGMALYFEMQEGHLGRVKDTKGQAVTVRGVCQGGSSLAFHFTDCTRVR